MAKKHGKSHLPLQDLEHPHSYMPQSYTCHARHELFERPSCVLGTHWFHGHAQGSRSPMSRKAIVGLNPPHVYGDGNEHRCCGGHPPLWHEPTSTRQRETQRKLMRMKPECPLLAHLGFCRDKQLLSTQNLKQPRKTVHIWGTTSMLTVPKFPNVTPFLLCPCVAQNKTVFKRSPLWPTKCCADIAPVRPGYGSPHCVTGGQPRPRHRKNL